MSENDGYTPQYNKNKNNRPLEDPLQERRSEYDVTNTVRVSSPAAVRRAVCHILEEIYPTESIDAVWVAFYDFERLYAGRSSEYFAADTTYHDIQHSLDMTLATARLVAGYEKTVESRDRLGAQRAMLGIACSLFHDMGYLRHRENDSLIEHGAELTRSHVSRSAEFLENYLPKIGLGEFVDVVASIVHFTGYERLPDEIELADPRDSKLGHLLGTADLLAQMSDRCYLEKCRDRLYPEFVLGKVAFEGQGSELKFRYRDARDLLSQTHRFFQESVKKRLDKDFDQAYRFLEAYFEDGQNTYLDFIDKNLRHLDFVVREERWDELRRKPPCVLADPDAEEKSLARAQTVLNALRKEPRENTRDRH